MIGLKEIRSSRLLIAAIGIAFFLTWKLTRLIILDFNFLWYIHIYILALLGLFSLLYFRTTHLNRLEVSFIGYLFFIVISVISNYKAPNFKFIGDFVISPLVFLPAVVVGKRLSDRSFLFLLNCVSGFILIYLVYEFVSVNFFDSSLIFYGNLSALNGTREFTRMMDWNGSIFLRMLNIASIRTMGVAFNVHATGALIGAFAIYHLHFFLKSHQLRKTNFILALLYTLLLLCQGSGTSMLFYLIMVLFIFRKSKLVVMLGPIVLAGAIMVMIDRRIDIYIHFIPDYTRLPLDIFLRLALFGDNQVTPYTYGSEFRMFGKPFAMGFGAFLFFHAVLYFAYKYINRCFRSRINYWPIWYFIISIYLGSYHYNTIFVFPNCLFLFFFCGFITGRHHMLLHGAPPIRIISPQSIPEDRNA